MRINAGDKSTSNAQDKAIADAYGNKFIIPLDSEMLDSAAPYYQAGLGTRLCYELTFNDYNRVTKSRVSSPKVPDAKYKITDISLEYEIATQPNLAISIRSEYQHMALLYDKILRHLQLYDLSLGGYLVNKYALWLNFRMIDENETHGTGRRIENASEGITLQIEKKAESAGALDAYIYLIMDAQLNIQNGAYVSAVY